MEESITQETAEKGIKHVIAVMSGKGGLGKTLITSLLAVALRRRGLHIGILDGDITCPGVVDVFGAPNEFSMNDQGQIEPLQSKTGIKIMSMSMFSENESDPLVWHGPMIASAFRQLYADVDWGQLDYLLIDVPSGTADVPMTVLQIQPLDGVIIVSTPQALSNKTVKKCVNMVSQAGASFIGLVENMANFIAPNGEYYEVFGASDAGELAQMMDAPLLARFPIDRSLAALCNAGKVETYNAETLDALATGFLKRLAEA